MQRIVLRKIADSDAQSIFEHAQDRQVSKYLSRVPYPFYLRHAKDFIKNIASKKGQFHFGIILKESNDLIGIIAIHHISRKHRKAMIGYWLGRKYWRKGFGTEALQLILDFGFKQLKLTRIYARVMVPNIASARLLEKAGFRHEGTLRKDVFIRGKWIDYKVYGLLKNEYLK